MPEEDKRLVNGVDVEDTEDVRVEVSEVEVVVLDEEEEDEVVVVVVVRAVVIVVVEVEEEDVVPSFEAPLATVNMSLRASWPAESII